MAATKIMGRSEGRWLFYSTKFLVGLSGETCRVICRTIIAVE